MSCDMGIFRKILRRKDVKESRDQKNKGAKEKTPRPAPSNDEQLNIVGSGTHPQPAEKAVAVVSDPHAIANTTTGSSGDATATATHNALWHKVYANLKNGEKTSKYIAEYEKLLLRVFLADKIAGTYADDDGNEPVSPMAPFDEAQMRFVMTKGLEKVKTAQKIISSSNKIQDAIAPVRAILDIPLKNVPQTALPWAIVTSSLDILMKPAKSLATLYDGVTKVNARIGWYSKMTDRLLSGENNGVSLEQVREILSTQMLELYECLLFYQIKSVCSFYRNQFVESLRAFVELDNWDGDLSVIAESEKKLRDDLGIYKQEQILNEVRLLTTEFRDGARLREDKQCLKDLYGIDPRSQVQRIQKAKGSSVKELYDWILNTHQYKSFVDWEDPESPNLLWINGQAGTGKTMLSVGVVQELVAGALSNVNHPEVFYFFIQHIGEEFSKSASILRSLMWLLLDQNPALIRHLRHRYDHSGATLFNSAQSFTDMLPIFQAMLQDEDLGRVVILLDALDECQGPPDECEGIGHDIFELMEVLLPTDGTASKIKILVTSRPLLEIDDMMKDISVGSKATIMLDEHSLSGPINAFIELKRPGLVKQAGSQSHADYAVQELKKNAGRTFIWVSLVCDRLVHLPYGRWKDTLKNVPSTLQSLYSFLLERLISSEQDEWFDYCKDVLLFVMLARRPLSLSELEALFVKSPCDIDLRQVVQDCRSFLTVQGDTVYLIHKSAGDFLKTNYKVFKKGCLQELHHGIFERALQSMSKSLERNMYKLANHGVSIDEADAPSSNSLYPVRYCCQYWMYHLTQAGLHPSDSESIHTFLWVHLLHWLEALSLLRILPVAMDTMNDLHSLIPSNGKLSRFVVDVKRFLSKFSSIIAQAPLQIYVSALVFAPERSEVRERFQEEIPRWVTAVRSSEKNWGSLLQSFQNPGNSKYRPVVAVSPIGDLMATLMLHSIHIHNIKTGILIRTLEQDWARSLAFSPCGKRLAVGSLDVESEDSDGTVVVWDTSKWKEVKSLLHPGQGISDCAFSPSEDALFTASGRFIWLWDLTTWNVRWSIPSCAGGRLAIAFSPEGLVASGVDNEIHLYNADSGALEHTFGKSDNFEYLPYSHDVAFSSNGTFAALVSFKEAKVWNVCSGAVEFVDQNGGLSVSFSPNSLFLAIGHQWSIELWNTQTWKVVQQFISTGGAWDLGFSSDGQILASASRYGVICLWDLTSGFPHQDQEHSLADWNDVRALTCSPTGKHVAATTRDRRLAVFDPQTGDFLYTRICSDWDISVLFSPDGDYILEYPLDGQYLILRRTETGDTVRQIQTASLGLRPQEIEKVLSHGRWECTIDGDLRIPLEAHGPVPLKPRDLIEYSWDSAWILRADGAERLIWVPPENRPMLHDVCAILGQQFASVDLSGRVSFLTFDLLDPTSV